MSVAASSSQDVLAGTVGRAPVKHENLDGWAGLAAQRSQ